ncbi:hypothetical protein [Bacteriovorax sp. Seq25_V]|uniref:hypothetical protein n=1 Tax=Bacteriovorax sp. Seq25_V TaxID=1201288 RepID=UPI00038A2B5D|nr:hypothetical protein [Bacteriovorax sp. Seq25_V]EQC43970.1 hypothetical protein M900_1188 [Bacteriovorax sp. Seq25_V]
MLKVLFLFTFLCLANAASIVPREKIKVSGKIKEGISKEFQVNYLEKFGIQKVKINDPYTSDKEIDFEGLSIDDIFKVFAPEAKTVDVTAINLYKIKIEKGSPVAKNLYFVFKEDGKYITVERMGPLRIVRSGLGVISKDNLVLEGAPWVWMVSELKFE